MRQFFLRTVAYIRGQRQVVDAPFHSDALYLVRPGERGRASDLLMPLWEQYRGGCAVALLAGQEDAACRRARETALRGKPGGGYVCRGASQCREVREIAQATAKVASLLTAAAGSGEWRAPGVRLVFSFHPGYTPGLMQLVRPYRPDVIVAGALGGHVPCWSNGKAGNKCSIERTAEQAHRAFWDSVGRTVRTAVPTDAAPPPSECLATSCVTAAASPPCDRRVTAA